MENVLVTSLVVSGLGMLLLFIALVVLYAVMYVMPSVFKDARGRPEPEEPEEAEAPAGEEQMLRAAAIAVALARAAQEMTPVSIAAAGEGTPAGSISHWWSFHHDRQLTRKPISRRTQ